MDNKISNVLAEIEEIPTSEVKSYLEKKYGKFPELISNVLKIKSINHEENSGKNFSSIVKKNSIDLIKQFNPEEYLGKVFGDWVVEDIISVTKKSLVFSASPADKTYDQNAAIKVIFPTFESIAGDNTSKQAHYISNLKHPNIVEGYGKGQLSDGTSYVVMELLTRQNIVEYCHNNSLNLKQILALFLQVSSGVDHMHINGCVHSDFNPSNIYMDINGVPKIIDFDLSLTTNVGFHKNHSYLNVNGLTRKYSAPEHLEEGSIATSLSDIYSMGCILLEMIVGSDQIAKKDYFRLLEDKLAGNWRKEEIISVIKKALNPEPVERYHGINEMMLDINRFLKKRRIVSTYYQQASFLYKARYFCGNYRKTITYFSVMILVCLFTLTSYLSSKNDSKEALKLLVDSSSPYISERDSKLNRKAEELFTSGYVITKDYYDKLLSFGDIYISRGDAFRAARFYKKAADLYPEKMSNEKIFALTKLAMAYFTQGERIKANKVIFPYGQDIFVDKVDSPYLMKMLMVAFEINNKFLQSTILSPFEKKITRSPSELLSSIDIKDFPESMKKDIEIELAMSKVKSDYYAFPGDARTILDNTTNEIYKTEITPMLKSCVKTLKGVLKKYKTGSKSALIKPEIYLWLSRCQAELGNVMIASEYNEIGLLLTEKIYGYVHAKTLHAYLVRHAIFHNKDTELSKEALSTALDIRRRLEKLGKSTDTFRFFTDQVVFESYFADGNFDESIKLLDKTLEKANKLDYLTVVDRGVLSTMLSYFTESLIHLYLPEKNKKKYEYYVEQFNKFNEGDRTYFIYDPLKSEQENLQLVEETFEYIVEAYDINNQSAEHIYRNSNESAVVAIELLSMQCTKIPGCDLPTIKSRLKFAKSKTYWGDDTYITRAARVSYGLVNAFYWLELKEYEESRKALSEISHLVSIKNDNFSSIYQSLEDKIFTDVAKN